MNLLQHEDSPYLLQHKHNPVNWQAWSEESLKLAEELNKPILVSIGYATCHWCHVMAHESFEDQETANLMNDYFINIKIDREERPDLDNYFMNAIQAMGIQGGWPLNCFLTPGGKVFYGGTYFPPEPKYGRPSWKQVLTAIHDAYKNNPTDIEMQAENLFTHLDEVNKINALHNQTEINLAEIFDRLNANFDTANGGFGTQPKFPNTQALQLLFHLYFIKGNKKARDHAILSLQQMCMGGIYDQIDGGFCRYSVDAQWNVPHFEKMLYDHAQIMQALATGYQFNKSEYFKMIANQSFHFFEKEMLDASGLYYSAMDADSAGEEGTYYVWTNDELAQLSEENLDLIKKVYSFTALDHLHTDIKVLRINPNVRNQDNLNVIIESCATAIEKLRNIRNKRIRPDIDHKMIVAWNAMLVSAYLSWHRAIPDNSNYLDKALRLIKSIIKNCCDDANHLCRYYIHGKQKAFGFLEDYSFVIKALIEIYFYTADKSFVEKALQLFDVVDLQFKDKESELYKLSSEKYTDFKISQTDWSETIYPNANAILSWACCFFYEFTGNEKYKNISKGLIKNIIPHALNHPLAMASWVQQLLLEEGGYYILKMQDPSQINRLKNIHIPGLMIIYENLSKDQFLICFNQNCYQTAAEPAEIISLFLKHDLHPENTY